MDINEKIREFIIYKDLQPSKLADELGISRPMMSHVLSGRNKPNIEIVMKILSKYPDLNPEWLNGNAPNMFREGASQESYLQENRYETKTIIPTIQPNSTQNLFNNQVNNQQEIEEEKAKNQEKSTEKHQENNENQSKKYKKSEGKTIEKIIVFYTDKSFDTYLN